MDHDPLLLQTNHQLGLEEDNIQLHTIHMKMVKRTLDQIIEVRQLIVHT